jgi:SAM-dependent methyltransferase
MKDNEAEKKVSRFYNSVGWDFSDGHSEDAKRFEDLRRSSNRYVSNCRLRVIEHMPSSGERLLDMASGPLQYPEYLEYSKKFREHHCVDVSKQALDLASQKLGPRGILHHGSFLDLTFEKDFFDCVISLHTIYHIDESLQEEVVRKLIDVVRPGSNVIIVYSNPFTLISKIERIRSFSKFINRKVVSYPINETLYFYPHTLDWWNRFNDVSELNIYPWRSLNSDHQKAIVPDNFYGRMFLQTLFMAEKKFPKFFVKNFQYPMIVLTKK